MDPAEDGRESAEGASAVRRAQLPIPLNSKRLSAAHLKRLATAMELPTEAVGDEVRQMIEGRLIAQGREPRNVQVVLGATPTEAFCLQDAEGTFLNVEEEEQPPSEHDSVTHDSESESSESELQSLKSELEAVKIENAELHQELEQKKTRLRELWRTNCQCLSEYDELMAQQEAEIRRLKGLLATAGSRAESPVSEAGSQNGGDERPRAAAQRQRRGKAPPVDPFTGENPEIWFEDWLPSLNRASTWNEWTDEELLLQLAGHLRGRALQEWALLDEASKKTYPSAVESLRARLDPGGRTLAAQDFRHTRQREDEGVATFIRRLERTFQIAYGHDAMSAETKDTLLHGQLQEGLSHEIMRAPAVSGSLTYKELCVASRNEEKRLAELRKRKLYQQPPKDAPRPRVKKPGDLRETKTTDHLQSQEGRKCYVCHKTGHMMRECPRRKTKQASSKQITTGSRTDVKTDQSDILQLLYSSDDEGGGKVDVVRVPDKGSRPKCARVDIQGVPAYGVIDSGSDVTIMGRELLRKVAAVAKLRKRDLKPPDKTPRNYDQRPFKLHGRMDLTISFAGQMLTTPVYIKLDAEEPLLLSEGVCRQLGIIQYHPDVEVRSLKQRQKAASATVTIIEDSDGSAKTEPGDDSMVPIISVRLVQSLRLPPGHCAVVPVSVDGVTSEALKLVESDVSCNQRGLELTDSLLQVHENGLTQMVVTNNSGFMQRVEPGTKLGHAVDVQVVGSKDIMTGQDRTGLLMESSLPGAEQCKVSRVNASDHERKQRLVESVDMSGLQDPVQVKYLQDFLQKHHQAFSLEPGERGETDLVEMEIDTGDASPRRQPVRRMPFAVRREVARQLREMQQSGVIRPSSSPWASPVVMVRKKDGSHRFCIDYRALNSITKPDMYPLPRIDDLLDQLGESHYFSTLDLASGYWQIRVHPQSVEKTAFAAPQGLFEFRVMPFGLMNAPSVFQRLMTRVLMGLNPDDGPDFVAVYIDDVLVFSRTLQDHIRHLEMVITRLQEAGLKLKPSKCHFIRKEVEYLGHVITPAGLRPTQRLTAAVVEFPPPQNVAGLRQFLGLSSYYRRFIPQFARVAKPLHELTRKGVQFEWSDKCQTAFSTLKEKLTQAPVLAYPCFGKPFVLETDASGEGIGAVLSQEQEDQRLHPVAYASRALSQTESKYAITELETLAVVWAMSHFHSLLYGHSVTVYTDHSAVQAVLNTPSPSGKHARWWTKVYGRGVKEVTIKYRPGKTNANADALSRCPQALAPEEGIAEDEFQVAAITGDEHSLTVGNLLQSDPAATHSASFEVEQRRDPALMEIIQFLERGVLPEDQTRARKLALQRDSYAIVDGVLYHLDSKRGHQKQVVVPSHLQRQIMEENHRGPMSAHFSGPRLFHSLRRCWWWENMFADTCEFVRGCPECVVVSGGGRVVRPELHPIPVSRPFQIIGVDVMDLPMTTNGNKHVLVFQDLFTKWPMVYAIPDQKSERIVKILVEEIVPFCGVPEALLSDRGTNLLSHLMRDVCVLLGTKKLNTTAYHPQCDGLVERYNRTLKTALRKHAARFGPQWDRLLSGVLWAYRNTPHESTHEKPSYLLFGFDCRTPTEAALLQPDGWETVDVVGYREELVMSLSSARELAAKAIQQAQKKYKKNYDKRASQRDYRLGEWVLVKFPAAETGKMRKLARPWHGPYRVVGLREPDVTVEKVYQPQDGPLQIHKTRVTPCPDAFPAGFHWYGDRRQSPGRPPRWVEGLLRGDNQEDEPRDTDTQEPEVLPELQAALQDEIPVLGTEASFPEDNSSLSSEDNGARDIEGEMPRRRRGLRQKVNPPERWQGPSSGRS